jgi:hypothetical protein
LRNLGVYTMKAIAERKKRGERNGNTDTTAAVDTVYGQHS